jgi:outer membrane receptor protein involved in Fe transport
MKYFYRFIIVLFLLNVFIINSSAHNTGTIKGIVTDASNNQYLPGASVVIKESIIGTTTSVDGVFVLKNIQVGKYVVQVTIIGYKKTTIDVEVLEDKETFLEIKMESATEQIEEVSIEGYRSYSAASSVELRKIDLGIRPARTSQDLLLMVPGLFIAQHAGGGKAEQIFIRGFDCDHGTDICMTVDGMPVNMVSHGHGQGYADLHFLIAETTDEVEVNKGPYFAEYGNFATGGSVSFKTKDVLDNSLLKIEGGEFNTKKMTFMYQPEIGGVEQNGYFAGQYSSTDGPFESPQNFQRLNVFGKYFTQISHNSKLKVGMSAFSSAWNASGQIPDRSIKSGLINRFGGLDNLEGGTTGRQNLHLEYSLREHSGNDLNLQAYVSNYDFKLFSNFTLYLMDTINGDMIEQVDNRMIYGINILRKASKSYGKSIRISKQGIGYRGDNIAVSLWHSPERNRLQNWVDVDIFERNLYMWAQEEFLLSSKFRVMAGIRADYFTFDVHDYAGTANDTLSGIPHASGFAQQIILSPKLNFVYSPISNFDIFINSGTGFHSNDARDVVIGQKVKELNDYYNTLNYSDEQIEQELEKRNFEKGHLETGTIPRASGAELGIKTKLMKRIHLSIAAWYLHLDKEFVYVGDGGVTELSDPTQRMGLDFETRIIPAKWIWLDADVCWAKPEIIGLPKGENHVPLAPTLTSSAGITTKYKGLEFAFRMRHISDRPANEDNSVVALGSTLFNAALAYEYKNIRLSVSIENIFDVEWNEAQFDTETRMKGEAQSFSELCYTPGNPRNFQFGISYKF